MKNGKTKLFFVKNGDGKWNHFPSIDAAVESKDGKAEVFEAKLERLGWYEKATVYRPMEMADEAQPASAELA